MKNEKDLTEIKLPEQIEELFNAIVKLDNVEDCYSFFDDLCTYKEVEQLPVEVIGKVLYARTEINS